MANKRFKIINNFSKTLINSDIPIIVTDLSIYEDIYIGKQIAKISIKNIGKQKITSLKIDVENTNKEQKNLEFNLNNLNLNLYDEYIGEFHLDYDEFDLDENLKFTVYELTLDEEVNKNKYVLAEIEKIDDIDLGDLLETYKREINKLPNGSNAKINAPYKELNENMWYCVCGKHYFDDVEVCPSCKVSHSDLVKITDTKYLTKKKEEYEKELQIKKETEEAEQKLRQEQKEAELRQKQEEKEKKKEQKPEPAKEEIKAEKTEPKEPTIKPQKPKKKKKFKKFMIGFIITIIVLGLLTVGGFFVYFTIKDMRIKDYIKNGKFESALKLEKNLFNKYNKYIVNMINSYEDAEEKIQFIENVCDYIDDEKYEELLLDSKYEYVTKFYEDKNYKQAYKYLNEVLKNDKYKDDKNLLDISKDIQYNIAITYIDDEKYNDAYDILKALNYKDSNSYLDKAIYGMAKQKADSEEYEEAKKLLESINNSSKETEELYNNCLYNIALKNLNDYKSSKKYSYSELKKIQNNFKNLMGYKDVSEIVEYIEYALNWEGKWTNYRNFTTNYLYLSYIRSTGGTSESEATKMKFEGNLACNANYNSCKEADTYYELVGNQLIEHWYDNEYNYSKSSS